MIETTLQGRPAMTDQVRSALAPPTPVLVAKIAFYSGCLACLAAVAGVTGAILLGAGWIADIVHGPRSRP